MNYHQRPFILKECKIELTYKCPLACIHCSSDATPENITEISKEKCLRIIQEAVDLGTNKISFSGGEPLQWDGIEEVIASASTKGMTVIIYSSGNIPYQNEKMGKLVSCGASRIVFSIFGNSALSHERITRRRGSFNNTIAAVEAAKEVGLNTEFHFVPLSINYKELPKVFNLATTLGVKTVSILRFVAHGRGHLIKRYSLDRLQNLELRKIIETARNNGLIVRTGSPFNFLLLNDQPECTSGIDRIIIRPDLRIYPCDAFKQVKAEELVGTLDFSTLDQWSLKECWERSPFLEVIRKYLITDFEEPCVNCNKLELCLSGCLAQKVLKSKDLRKQPDPMCIMNRRTGGYQ
ncbi:MAG: radical SAM protein [Patescibacteria group bacterium]